MVPIATSTLQWSCSNCLLPCDAPPSPSPHQKNQNTIKNLSGSKQLHLFCSQICTSGRAYLFSSWHQRGWLENWGLDHMKAYALMCLVVQADCWLGSQLGMCPSHVSAQFPHSMESVFCGRVSQEEQTKVELQFMTLRSYVVSLLPCLQADPDSGEHRPYLSLEENQCLNVRRAWVMEYLMLPSLEQSATGFKQQKFNFYPHCMATETILT